VKTVPGSDVEGGKEGGSAMVNVVMGDTFHVAQSHRQDWLRAIERLNLGLLIDREYDGVIRRIQVKTHDIAYLFHEEGIAGQLEVLRAVGLDGKRSKDSMHGGFRESVGIGCLTNTLAASCRWSIGSSSSSVPPAT
jgi:hypothetical protein